jgi:hypothetical protein
MENILELKYHDISLINSKLIHQPRIQVAVFKTKSDLSSCLSFRVSPESFVPQQPQAITRPSNQTFSGFLIFFPSSSLRGAFET